MNALARILLTATLALTGSGCISELLDPTMPVNLRIPSGEVLDSVGRQRLSGVYWVAEGSPAFGDTLVALYARDHFCFYAGKQVIFSECVGGIRNDTASFNGYYRFVRSQVSGYMSFAILPDDGGTALHGSASAGPITMRGFYQDPKTDIYRHFTLIRVRDITAPSREFQIIGNCAGGRNSERLGRSENSINMVRFAEYLGCTGIEIDLHTTNDGEVILMHDDTFSPRTVQSTYILGDVWRFTLKQIRHNARLIHGEEIPTIEEFLRFVVDSTNLEFVWLDPKVTTGIERILQAQQAALDRAAQNGRKLVILYGIPSQDILDAYRQAPSANKTPVLCELAPDIVRSLPSCRAWGPRWTAGLQTDMVCQMQSEGYKVYPWTIDSPEYLAQFLEQRQCPFDGILSDYPSMLTGMYHLRVSK